MLFVIFVVKIPGSVLHNVPHFQSRPQELAYPARRAITDSRRCSLAKEIEFKFLVEPERADQVKELTLISSKAEAPPKLLHLISTYYDTADLQLRSLGLGLRIRSVEGGWIQTMKGGASRSDGLSIREEVEFPLQSNQLDCSKLIGSAFDNIGHDTELHSRLEPMFITDFHRLRWVLLLDDGSRIEVALDRGAVVHGALGEPICELELELISGTLAGMEDFSKQLLASFHLTRGNRSKAQRGYELMQQANKS